MDYPRCPCASRDVICIITEEKDSIKPNKEKKDQWIFIDLDCFMVIIFSLFLLLLLLLDHLLPPRSEQLLQAAQNGAAIGSQHQLEFRIE